MRKLLFIMGAVLFAHLFPAQTCNCNPNGFNPFSYSYLDETRTVQTGNQFAVKCGTAVKLDGGYKCSYNPGVCDVQFSAVVKNSSGAVIKTISPFSFPWEDQFAEAGNYILEITPVCGKNNCTKAVFYFNVKCDAAQVCKCNAKTGWNKLFSVLDGKSKELKCGESLSIKKYQKFGIKGEYKCRGNCNSVLKGSVINTDSGETQNFDSINLDGNPLDFPKPGKYKLIITPVCKEDACEPCVIYVTVFP